MNEPSFAKDDSLDPVLVEEIDDVCGRFQAAWQSGEEPGIGDFLGDSSEPLRSALLKELLRLELHYRDPAAETLDVQRYHKLFPDHVELIDSLFAKAEVGDAKADIPDTIDWSVGSTQDPDKPQVPAETAAPAKRFGRFELREMLGRGGFGSVHRARDPQLHRDVALKFPRTAALMDDHDVQRFMREARAAAQLRHPNLVPVYEAGEIDGTYYIASAFVPGKTLRDTVKQKEKFSVREAATLIAKLAEALHFAHQKGIIHRDMKPENVMIDDKGQPHIMDFGLARRDEGEELLTQEGSRMGTPAYMSPEQAKGKSHTADARTDLWALGVMLYELLTGRRPFTARGHEIITQIIGDEPEPPRKLDRSIPKDLETICLKCLSKQPGQRYQSCQLLHEELHRWLEDKPIQARPIARIERIWRWCRRNPLPSVLTASVGLGVIVGLKPALLVPLAAAVLVTWFVSWFFHRVKTARQADQKRQVRLTTKGHDRCSHPPPLLERLRAFVNREGSYFQKIGAASVTWTLDKSDENPNGIWIFTIESEEREEPGSFEPISVRVKEQDGESEQEEQEPSLKWCQTVENLVRAHHAKQKVVDLGRRHLLIAIGITAGAFTAAGVKQWISGLLPDEPAGPAGPEYGEAERNELWKEYPLKESADEYTVEDVLDFVDMTLEWMRHNGFAREDLRVVEAFRRALGADGEEEGILEVREEMVITYGILYAEPSAGRSPKGTRVYFTPTLFREKMRFIQQTGSQSHYVARVVLPLIEEARKYRAILGSQDVYEEINKTYETIVIPVERARLKGQYEEAKKYLEHYKELDRAAALFLAPDYIKILRLRRRLLAGAPAGGKLLFSAEKAGEDLAAAPGESGLEKTVRAVYWNDFEKFSLNEKPDSRRQIAYTLSHSLPPAMRLRLAAEGDERLFEDSLVLIWRPFIHIRHSGRLKGMVGADLSNPGALNSMRIGSYVKPYIYSELEDYFKDYITPALTAYETEDLGIDIPDAENPPPEPEGGAD